MNIAIDLDDVMIDLCGSWVRRLNEKHGTSVSVSDITSWDITKFFPDLTKNEVFAPLYESDFWDTVTPKKGAVQTVRKIIDDGHNVIVCTNTNYKSIKNKMEKVLFRYFDYISWEDVVIIAEKQLMAVDILIDDNPNNLIGGRYCGILMNAPHNKPFRESMYGIVRARNWDEVYNIILLCKSSKQFSGGVK